MNVLDNREGELLRKFAEKYKLRVTLDDCRHPVIIGSRGDIYEYGPSELGLMILSPDEAHPRLWNFVRQEGLEVGMTLRQDGDAEGSFSFDPENKDQARLAIKFTRVRPKKQISAEQKEKLLAGLRRYKNSRSEAIQERALQC